MIDYAEEIELQRMNGRAQFDEIGSPGLEIWFGRVSEAYHADLEWPGVFDLYNRLRRSDPEIGGIIRPQFVNMARKTDWRIETVDTPGPVDEAAVEFLTQALNDIEGGINGAFESWVSYAPFMGWDWYEIVYGLRRREWRPPDGSEWRSEYDDGLIGIRRLAHRDHSSFKEWDIDDATGVMSGMVQQDYPNPDTTIPKDRSLHLTFGDNSNPEGLSPLEAVWRIERRQRNYEIVHGIGAEHTAGHLKFKKEEGNLSTTDKSHIKSAARSAMSAKEGNYLAVPGGVDAEILDVPFSAAASIESMIRYLSLVKLQIYQMQFVAIAVTSGLGSQTAIEDSRAQALSAYNGMLQGFANQFTDQVIKRLMKINAARFPGLTRTPRLVTVPIERTIPLQELGAFMAAVAPIVPLDEEDYRAFRQRTGFLPTDLPEQSEALEPEPLLEDEAIRQETEEMIAWMIDNKPGFKELWYG